ncbi:hypothetical protein [Costertonia aggregata]|uniref:Uncharacterized protein n=1 Tax=Costertonia aggregata TaxID=343403 RepID=A0A7H9AN85_9FLAO|nr:hypothetical protein [Costertonia aggregata]QLG44906.1 hypothetical protein HYG79_05910 [Costertonia aggregata]
MKDYLNPGEEFFIALNREFEFLRIDYGYQGNQFTLNSRDERIVSYYNHVIKRKITIVEQISDGGNLYMFIEIKSVLGLWKKKYLKDYTGRDIQINSLAHLTRIIKSNTSIMNDIIGR